MDNPNSTKQTVKLTKDFIFNKLSKDQWFKKINNKIDFILLTGSSVQGNKKKNSDIDLFIFIKHEWEKKLKPGCSYHCEYKNNFFEMSIVATEKMVRDAETKDKICWYANAKPIFWKKKRILQSFKKAAKMTKEEKKTHLWTNYILFTENLYDLKKCLERKNYLGAKILLGDLIRFYIDSIFVDKTMYLRPKQYSRLPEIKKQEYETLWKTINEKKETKLIQKLEHTEKELTKILLKNGFKQKHIDNSHRFNLYRIKFQLY